MTHKFEVGDTGKTNAGARYEVIGKNDIMLFVAISGLSSVVYDVRDLNGGTTMHSVTRGQLIPTLIKSIRNVWLNVYAAGCTSAPCVYGYDHEKDAKNGACRASDSLVIALPVQLEWEQ